ncbi:MAG: hypothetical protein V3U71_05930 [Cocleimonas sp.]
MIDYTFDLPAPNEEVPLSKIKEICLHFQLPDLWDKIKKDPPSQLFSSDGCTMWPDVSNGKNIYVACFLHDLKYWSGYPDENIDRLVADAELMIDVARIRGSTKIAETMFHGVRVGGTGNFKLAFSWGFGRII